MDILRNSGWTFVTIAILAIPGFLCQSVSKTSVCRESPDPARTGETAVHGYKAGCFFMDTLCKYTQGCSDQGMTNWTVTGPEAGAVAKQSDPGAGQNTYSVLESPLFRLTHTSCVEFRYSNRLPSDLDVFGVANRKTTQIFNGPRIENTNGTSIKVTVSKHLSRLKFRAYGGGGGAPYPPVRLLQVAINDGRCTGPECNFTTGGRPTWCEWTNTGWELNPPVVQLKAQEVNGTLTTDLTRRTTGRGLCVDFDYYMDSINDILSVSIQYMDGSEEPVWATAYNGNGTSLRSWPTVRMLITSAREFRLVFRAIRCNNLNSSIAITNVTSEPYNSNDCEGKSPDAVKQVSLYEGCDPTTTTTVTTQSTTMSSPVTGSVSSTTNFSDSLSSRSPTGDTTDASGDNDGDGFETVVTGCVVAGVVLIIVVIIVVLLWRKQRSNGGGNDDKKILRDQSVQPHQQSPSNVGGTHLNPAFVSSPPADGDYSEVNEMAHSRSADPYEDVGFVPSGETNLGDTDEYNCLNLHGTREKDASTTYDVAGAVPTENKDLAVNDEYHHLGRQGMAKKKADPQGTAAEGAEYSHIGQEGTRNFVRKDDYNRIDLKEKGPEQRGATPDVYSRLGRDATAGPDAGTGRGQAYDHVQDDFQDTYDKPHRDKKETVIDSNYDHVAQK